MSRRASSAAMRLVPYMAPWPCSSRVRANRAATSGALCRNAAAAASKARRSTALRASPSASSAATARAMTSRAAVDRLALLAAAAALRQSAPEVANLFARTRLEEGHGAIYGTSEISPDDARRLIERALPSA